MVASRITKIVDVLQFPDAFKERCIKAKFHYAILMLLPPGKGQDQQRFSKVEEEIELKVAKH